MDYIISPKANAARHRLLRRGAGQRAGLRRGREAVAGLLRPVPCRRRAVLQEHLVLEHADDDLPRRPGRHLHGLRRLDPGLDRDHRRLAVSTPSEHGRARAIDMTTHERRRRRRPPARRGGWRRRSIVDPGSSWRRCSRRPLGWLVIAYLGLARAVPDHRRSGRSTRSPATSITQPTLDNYQRILERRRSTGSITVRTVIMAARRHR